MKNNIETNVKSWARDLEGFEDAWAYRGAGVFSLGGQSVLPLPSNVYSIGTNMNGDILYCAINVTTDSLIRFPNSKNDEIINTIEKFWESKEQYEMFGQVYKRGLLLHGEPGCGKTGMLNLLFEQLLRKGGLVFVVGDPYLTIKAVERLRMVEPNRNLILLYEDIDSLFERYGESHLLSMLDGELQFPGVLHLATTNYLWKIPARLKNRPSRFDEVIEIFPPNTDERSLFIRHLMQPVEDKSKVLEMIRDTENFSLAHIKELIISVYLLEQDYYETLKRLKKMMEEK